MYHRICQYRPGYMEYLFQNMLRIGQDIRSIIQYVLSMTQENPGVECITEYVEYRPRYMECITKYCTYICLGHDI